GIAVRRDAVAKVFTKWRVHEYASAFVSNLQRLESLPPETEPCDVQPAPGMIRLADMHFVQMWQGMQKYPLRTAAPGLFTLWAYIEELGILPLLEAMGLTKPPTRGGYAWLDLLLFDMARRFFGISTASAACEAEMRELSYFAHLFRAPCNDTLLGGLCDITQKQTTELRQWLVQRLAGLGLASGRRLAFDFHQIDQDVILATLRQFGKGPSSKKKCCCNGFRPHIAWDIDQGTLLVAEFRKASARGPTTIRRFIAEHILPTFRDLFDTVYIDSEYTGKDVWNFILDKDKGMGADLVACLKQNALVRKARDKLLNQNADRGDFWRYYDDHHVYGVDTFPLQWKYTHPQSNNTTVMQLRCVIKKHVQTGKLRCFGSSKLTVSASDIFADYSHRWTIENGIKDLVQSYFMDKCPGETPHAVDVHLLVMTICRTLYRMIERDLGDSGKNADGTTKTLARMRDTLFRQGPGSLRIEDGALVISLDKPYTPKRTHMLRAWFDTIAQRHRSGLTILGGLALRFQTQPALGPEFKNAGKKLPLTLTKNPDSDAQEESFL
ncbi:MAG: transposase, partial [Pirellulaceae bacterium]